MYTYKWTEKGRGPYEVTGDALSIYRAAILIGHGRQHIIIGDVLQDGVPINKSNFFTACIKQVEGDVRANSGHPAAESTGGVGAKDGEEINL